MATRPRPLALVGSTATGKTALAVALARRVPGVEVVSADSMQVYRGMDVGTAKATAAERAAVPHHALDLADPHEDVTVVTWRAAADAALADVASRGGWPVVVGGTGLYVQALVDRLDPPGRWPEVAAALDADPDTAGLHARLGALDPVAAARIEPANRRRIVRALEVCLGSGRPFSAAGPGVGAYPEVDVDLVGLRLPRPELDARIAERFAAQLAAGFLDEVRRLRDAPAGLSRTARQALGYRELLEHLDGRLGLDEAVELAVTRTRRFARRQERWFRRDPRIRWLDVAAAAGPEDLADAVLAALPSPEPACA